MPWGGHRASWCHGCGRHVSEVGPLSARYKCTACSESAQLENVRQLVAHKGDRFDHWLERCRAAFGIPAGEEPAELDDSDAEAA